MNAGAGADTVDSDFDSNIFISKLLGEMKNQFNRTENVEGEQSDSIEQAMKSQELTTEVSPSYSGNNQGLIIKDKSAEVFQKSGVDDHVYVMETMKSEMNLKDNLINLEGTGLEPDCDDEKGTISVNFKKPYSDTNSASIKSKVKTDESPVGRRSLRNKSNSAEEKIGESTLKRSARRRSKDCNESVLQSAIARKEKSYNESNKPQRLTRPLKSTSKVLEHLALLKNEKSKSLKTDDKSKPDSDCVDNENSVLKKKLVKYKTVRRKARRLRYNNNDSSKEFDSDVDSNKISNSIETSDVSQHPRRISCFKDDSIMGDEISSEGENSEANVEHSLVTSQLISSRLCLCTKKTQLYPATDDQLYCGAIDSLGEKLVGCSRIVNRDMPLLRPSYRVPYSLYCVVHKNRMIRHNCCPTCGIFCTQGRFTQCELLHQYHRACQISVGDIECCPHCGSSTPKHDIYITMYSSKKPAFLTFQRGQSTTNNTTG